MSGDAYDALLGILLNAGVRQELRGGLNFSGDFLITPDDTNNRNDLGLNVDVARGFGLLQYASGGTYFSITSSLALVSGPGFALNAASTSNWAAVGTSPSTAEMVWSGSSTTVLVAVAMHLTNLTAGDQIGVQFAVDGTPVGTEQYVDAFATGTASIVAFGLVPLAQGATLSVHARDVDNNHTTYVVGFQMLALAIG